jgi:hypothetical protein
MALKPPAWVKIDKLDEGFFFRSRDWMVMGNWYATEEEAVRGSWTFQDRLTEAQGETNQTLTSLEKNLHEMMLMNAALIQDLLRYKHPDDSIPTIRQIVIERWGVEMADKIAPKTVAVLDDEDDDDVTEWGN